MAVPQDGDAVGDFEHFIDVVRDEYDGNALRHHSAHEFEELVDAGAWKERSWFVEDQHSSASRAGHFLEGAYDRDKCPVCLREISHALVGVEVEVASPAGYRLEGDGPAILTDDPFKAAHRADAIYTDVWVSMGDEATAEQRRVDLEPYRLDAELLAAAKPEAVVMHCLPAHPGEEITAELLYGERSVVFDQAENRLHAQKALLEYLLA